MSGQHRAFFPLMPTSSLTTATGTPNFTPILGTQVSLPTPIQMNHAAPIPLNQTAPIPLNQSLIFPPSTLYNPSAALGLNGNSHHQEASGPAAQQTSHQNGITNGSDQTEWIEFFNDEGKPYYYNVASERTTWTRPERFRTAPRTSRRSVPTAAPVAAVVWKEYRDTNGKPYYYNLNTKKTTWTKPDDFDSTPRPNPVTSINRPIEAQPIPLPTMPSDMEKAMEATLKQFVPPPLPREAPIVPIETTDPNLVKQRSLERFRELLRDKYADEKITTSMTWDHAVRYIQHDPRFSLVNKMSEKKRIFNEWKTQQQKDEREARKIATRKAKEDLEQFLLTHKKVRPTLVYSKADRLFTDEAAWKAVSDVDRKDVFKDALVLLRRRLEKEEAQLKENCQKQLADILDSLPEISYRSTWAETQRLLAEHPNYAENLQLKKMEKMDALDTFAIYIRKAEREHVKEREASDKCRRREQRKARDDFLDLLTELQSQGAITSTSTWVSTYPRFRSDSRFKAMLNHTGSTPLDMFKFYVEDLKNRYFKDKRIIRDLLEKQGKDVELDTPFEEFEKWIRSEERAKEIDSGNLKLCFDSLVEKAAAKVKETVKVSTKKQSKKNDLPPLKLFETIVPRIRSNDNWDTAKSRVMADPSFADVEEESAEKAFVDYINALKDNSIMEAGEIDESTHKKDKKAKKRKKEKKEKKKKSRKEEISGDEKHEEKHRHRSGGDTVTPKRKHSRSPSNKPKKSKKAKRDDN